MRRAWGTVLVAGATAGWLGACGMDSDLAQNGTGGRTGTTTTSSSSSTSSTTTPTGAVFVGLACTEDGECGEEGYCMKATDTVAALASFWGETNAGGPAGGYCTRSCDADEDCPGLDSRCLGRQPDAFCVLGCPFGTPEMQYLDEDLPADKCHGRDDLMCSPVTVGGAVCIPVCGTDAECPSERACDLQVGLCVDQPREGDPMGAPCVPDDDGTPQDEDTCAGHCQTFVDDQQQTRGHMCSSYCSLGGDLDTTNNCGGPQSGLCLFQLTFSGEVGGLGDMSVCSNACTSHADCNYLESLFCFDHNTVGQLGHGFCSGATDCPVGNECRSGQLCTATAYGPVCIEEDPQHPGELLFPLGAAAGGAGGAGGAVGAGGAGAAAGAGGAGAAAGAGGAGGSGGT